MYSAITSAIGTLAGPLHGGANEAVMKMLLEIGEPEKVDAHLANMFATGQKVMGFGHRVYHTEDPRATHLRRMSEATAARQGNTKWFAMSQRVEELVTAEMDRKGKKIRANVDFYSASTYYMLGITVDLFTPIFAVSRISGWTAHVLEQLQNNRLIRPRADYTGARPSVEYVALENR
jgi:citrate synthase